MAVSRIAALGACLVAGVCALSARASSGSDGASCVAVSDDTARLACYDRAYGRNAAGKSAATAGAVAAGTAAAPKSPAVATPKTVQAAPAAPAAATPKDPVAEFGLTEAAKQAKDPAKAAEAAKAPTSVTAKVISLRFKKYGEFVVTLDNGQVWEQNEPMPSAIVRVGDTVTVKKAVLGSYTLVTAAKVATKVHRVD
jgi:FtsP/CotA-like multicopper oxidase with cupredoxin domain